MDPRVFLGNCVTTPDRETANGTTKYACEQIRHGWVMAELIPIRIVASKVNIMTSK